MQVHCERVCDKLVSMQAPRCTPGQRVATSKQCSKLEWICYALSKLACVPLCSGLHWIVLVSCALLVSLDFWSSLIHQSSGKAGVHWVLSHLGHVHSSKKRNDTWHFTHTVYVSSGVCGCSGAAAVAPGEVGWLPKSE